MRNKKVFFILACLTILIMVISTACSSSTYHYHDPACEHYHDYDQHYYDNVDDRQLLR